MAIGPCQTFVCSQVTRYVVPVCLTEDNYQSQTRRFRTRPFYLKMFDVEKSIEEFDAFSFVQMTISYYMQAVSSITLRALMRKCLRILDLSSSVTAAFLHLVASS